MSEESPAIDLWIEMVALWKKLKAAKPTERTETARRYAVSITEFEKAMAYFNMFVMMEIGMPGDGDEDK